MNKNPKSGKQFYWNGEPVQDVKFGYVVQTKNEEHPMYWYNCEIERQKELGIEPCMIPAISILAKDATSAFVIANIAGAGVEKLEGLGMWYTSVGHLSLSGDFYEDEALAVYEYNKENHALYLEALDVWQQTNFPDEWARLQALKKSIEQRKSNCDIDLSKTGLVDCNGNAIKPQPTQGKSGATSLHLKFRNGKKR